MNPTQQTLRYALTLILILLVSGLAMWYFFLRAQIKGLPPDTGESQVNTTVSPFSNTGSTYNNVVSGVSGASTETGVGSATSTTRAPQLWHVTKTPIAGVTFEEGGATPKLQFVERSTGYLFEADPAKSSVTRLTNKLFPKTYEALFGPAGSVVLRLLDERGVVKSFSGTIATSPSSPLVLQAASTTPVSFVVRELPENIKTILLSARGSGLFYLVDNPAGGVTGIRSLWDGTNSKASFSSLLSNWRPFSLPDGRTFLLQSPADDISGYAYQLLDDGSLSSVVRGVPGLTFLPHDGSKAIVFGVSFNGSLSLFSRIDDTTTAVALPIKTIADKCVWAPPPVSSESVTKKPLDPLIAYCAVPVFIPSRNFLDDWYRGVVHTSDSWWRVDTRANTVTSVPTFNTSAQIDVENPIIDESGKSIAFMNAQDQTLWLLRLDAAPGATR